MAVTSIGTLGTSLSSFYQSVSGSAQPSTLTAIWNPTAPADTPASDQNAQPVSRTSDRSFSQIEAAVNNALSAAQSDATADPSAIIRQAIGQVFASTATPAGTNAPADSNSNAQSSADSADADGQGDSNDPAATQAYLAALHSLGVNPQQFQEDWLSAVQDAQQGKVDPSAVFRNFPLGSSLDAVA